VTRAIVTLAAFALAALAFAAEACAPRYREPPPTDTRPRTQGGPTVVGTITSEGEVVADTLAGEVPDAERAHRETVVTGAVARAAEPEPEGARPDGSAPAPAPGPWAVQVFAAEEEAAAVLVARDAERTSGAPAHVDHEAGWYKVRLGGYADRAAAEALRRRLAPRWGDAFLVQVAGS